MSAIIKLENTSGLSSEKLDLIKRTVCKNATDDELQLFLHVCQRTGLDPFLRQIYSVPRGKERTIQVSIEGLRLIAERTGKYAPGKEPSYNYSSEGKLLSATSHLKKMTGDGTWHEVSSTAIYEEYNPGGFNTFWKKMPHVMLAKCAEANALRKAFPSEMGGLYVKEEMDQAVQDQAEPNEIIVQREDPEFEAFQLNKFCNSFPAENPAIVNSYIQRYAKHYEKSILESIKDQDIATFSKNLTRFKEKLAKEVQDIVSDNA